jgi:hypothetical protein
LSSTICSATITATSASNHACGGGVFTAHTGVPALYDGRGPGYARESDGVADTDAYEVEKNDIVFSAGLAGCP